MLLKIKKNINSRLHKINNDLLNILSSIFVKIEDNIFNKTNLIYEKLSKSNNKEVNILIEKLKEILRKDIEYVIPFKYNLQLRIDISNIDFIFNKLINGCNETQNIDDIDIDTALEQLINFINIINIDELKYIYNFNKIISKYNNLNFINIVYNCLNNYVKENTNINYVNSLIKLLYNVINNFINMLNTIKTITTQQIFETNKEELLNIKNRIIKLNRDNIVNIKKLKDDENIAFTKRPENRHQENKGKTRNYKRHRKQPQYKNPRQNKTQTHYGNKLQHTSQKNNGHTGQPENTDNHWTTVTYRRHRQSKKQGRHGQHRNKGRHGQNRQPNKQGQKHYVTDGRR